MIVYRKEGEMLLKHDPDKEVVAIFLTEEDKWNIAHMTDDMTVYCVYPEDMDPEDAMKFIRDCKVVENKE